MDLRAGYPFWLIKNGLSYNYPFLEKDLKTEVLILGGGIAGALMTYYLVNSAVPCALIDGRTIGLGSTCASTSLLQYEIDTSLSELSQKIGKEKAETAYQLCSHSIDELEKIAGKLKLPGFERTKSLYFAASKKDLAALKTEFLARKKAGLSVSFLDKKAIQQQFDFKAPGAILSAQAAQVDAYSFTHELLQYGIKKGAGVYDRTMGSSIKYVGNKVIVTTDKGFKIKANHLVYATGYESSKYIDKKYLGLKSTYAICSEQMNKGDLQSLAGTIFWNTADPYLYLRLTADNRVLIGGRDEDFYNPAKRDELLKAKVKLLTSDFKRLFPHIPFKPEFSWAGTFATTRDGLPFIGSYKNKKNCYFSLGFGGNGIIFSQVGAKIITALVTGKKNKYGEIFSFDRI